MAKETASFKLRPETKNALIKEAEKERRTLSFFIENIIEQYAKKKKLV
jgi:predicted DNA-binding protein